MTVIVCRWKNRNISIYASVFVLLLNFVIFCLSSTQNHLKACLKATVRDVRSVPCGCSRTCLSCWHKCNNSVLGKWPKEGEVTYYHRVFFLQEEIEPQTFWVKVWCSVAKLSGTPKLTRPKLTASSPSCSVLISQGGFT